MKIKNYGQLTNVVVVICCLMLATSYFLPVENLWSPVDAWRGYYVGGEFVKKFNMGLVETFPFGVGIIVLLSLALLKKPGVSIAIVAVFAAIWVASLAYEVSLIVQTLNSRFPVLWLALAMTIIPATAILFLLCLRKYRKVSTILTLGAILAASSVLQQSCSIAWYLVEDKLFLNIGCVTGMVSAVVILIGLLIKRQISCQMSDSP